MEFFLDFIIVYKKYGEDKGIVIGKVFFFMNEEEFFGIRKFFVFIGLVLEIL